MDRARRRPACRPTATRWRCCGATWRALRGPARLPGLPPLTGGLVGYLGYDVVRRIERLPDDATDDLGLPELTMLLATDLAVVDHDEARVLLIANALVHAGRRRPSESTRPTPTRWRRLDAMTRRPGHAGRADASR